MKFSRTRNFRTMFLEQPFVFRYYQREVTSFYFSYARHKIQTFSQKKLYWSTKELLIKFRSIYRLSLVVLDNWQKALNITIKEITRAGKFYYLKGRNFRRGECSGLAGLKTANSVELISTTGSLLRTSRNLFSRWNDSKGCKGNNGKINDIKGTYFFI